MRGEAIIQAGDKEVRVLFNNRALAEAESGMGKSIVATLGKAQAESDIGINDMAQLLRAGMTAERRANGKGKPATMLEAFTVLDWAGFTLVTTCVMEAVAAVLAYNPSDNGETAEDDPNE